MTKQTRFRTLSCVLLMLPALASVQGQNIDMGETYRAIERRASVVVTEYPNLIATTHRATDGGLKVEVQEPSGRIVSQWTIPPEGPMTVSAAHLAGGTATMLRPAFEPSADWANLQAVSLWRDLRRARRQNGVAADAAQLVWSGPLLRPWQLHTQGANGSRQRAEALEREALRVTSTFVTDTGVRLVARSLRETRGAVQAKAGLESAVATFSTELVDPETSTTLGILRWFEEPQVLVWKLPGVGEGWVDPDRQKAPFSFDPDLAWGTVQIFSFWEKEAAAALNKAITLKDTPGCTGLHWLDQTIYRECCDDHDKCYASDQNDVCSATSWWLVNTSWRCIKCNIDVVTCFLTTFFGGGGTSPPDDVDPCTVEGSAWCPAECFTCNRTYY